MGAPAPEQPSLGLGLGTPSSPLLPYDDESNLKMTPAAVVERLNRFIIGQVLHREAESVWLPNARCSTRWHACLIHALNYTQDDAKKAVAVAFRNRWRRHRVQPQSLKAEIQPKNILMIGPTGGGMVWCWGSGMMHALSNFLVGRHFSAMITNVCV